MQCTPKNVGGPAHSISGHDSRSSARVRSTVVIFVLSVFRTRLSECHQALQRLVVVFRLKCMAKQPRVQAGHEEGRTRRDRHSPANGMEGQKKRQRPATVRRVAARRTPKAVQGGSEEQRDVVVVLGTGVLGRGSSHTAAPYSLITSKWSARRGRQSCRSRSGAIRGTTKGARRLSYSKNSAVR